MSDTVTIAEAALTLPTLHTERLVLRPFVPEDAPEVQRLAGDRRVASTTLNIPHPYEAPMAVAWIATHGDAFATGERVSLAITLRDGGALVGAIGLGLSAAHRRGEMGYWIGVPYWGRGYCTEAAGAMLRYGFDTLHLHRIHAAHLTRNPASGRVMAKIGMRHEGRLRGHFLKWGVFEDVEKWGVLREDLA